MVRTRFRLESVWFELEPGRGDGARSGRAPPDLAGLQVGSYEYLKNFRRGSAYQRERCVREIGRSRDAATAEELTRRFRLIDRKLMLLNRRH